MAQSLQRGWLTPAQIDGLMILMNYVFAAGGAVKAGLSAAGRGIANLAEEIIEDTATAGRTTASEAATVSGAAESTGAERTFLRAVPQDQVGTSQAFKLRGGEQGLSVFEGVSNEQVLSELPGGRVPNVCIGIL
jgi:hypothetical protein